MIMAENLKKPEVRIVEMAAVEEPAMIILKNGIKVYLIESGTEEMERMDLTFRAGAIAEKLPLLASTVSMMLTEGTASYKAQELNRLLDSLTVYFNPYSDRDRSGVTTCFLNKHIERVLDLTGEILFSPSFPASELKLLMDKRLRSFLVDREKVSSLAADKFFESLFGESHPFGRIEQPSDFSNITTKNLKEFHSRYYRPSEMAVIVSGKIPGNIGDILNRHFGDGKITVPEALYEKPEFSPSKTRKSHVEKKGAVQSAIRIGCASIGKKDPDYQGLKVANTILGGYFGSRLMKNIREEKGYTYGISSSLVSVSESGYISISAEVSKKTTQLAINEIYSEIRRLQSEPVGADELNVVRNFMMGSLVRMFDGPFARAESFRSVWEFGLDNSWYQRFAEKIRTITAEELMDLFKRYFDIEKMYEITAG